MEKNKNYEAPVVKVVGSVYGLTQMPIDKNFQSADGVTFMGIPIGNSSP